MKSMTYLIRFREARNLLFARDYPALRQRTSERRMHCHEHIGASVVQSGSRHEELPSKLTRSLSPKRQVERACLVAGARQCEELISLLKDHFRVELTLSESGVEYKDDEDMVFVCDDFDNCPHFSYLHSCGARILGPAVIRLRAHQSKELLMPLPNRPLYTDSMAGMRIVLSFLSGKESCEAVNLIHFMGGKARRHFSSTATHLVTEVARGSNYRSAVSMGRPVLHLQWLRAAWALRDHSDICVTSPDFTDSFAVEPFCGLSIWLIGPEDETIEMRQKIIEYKGKLASSQEEATHVVVSCSAKQLIQPTSTKQCFVSEEWFWLSVQMNCCANEQVYARQASSEPNVSLVEHRTDRSENVSSRSLFSNMEGLSTSGDNLNKSTRSVCRLDKRLAVCREMLETEENYLNALKTIDKIFKGPLETQLIQTGSALLSKAEIAQIFSRVSPLIYVHERIFTELKKCLLHSSANHLIGKIWFDSAKDLLPLYKAFISNYDTAIETLNRCDRSNPKFHAFLKVAETRADCGRSNLRDLLVRPVQRIPSVLLLLKAIHKKTDRSNRDSGYLIKAMRALDTVLTMANESRKRAEAYEQMFKICNEIERFPIHIMSSARTLVAQLHVVSLGGEDEWSRTRGKSMVVFLFNDLIEIAKEKNATASESPSRRNMLTVSRQFAASLFRHERKRYKHYQKYMLTSIRHIDIIGHCDYEGVFVLSFRLIGGENFWVAQHVGGDPGEIHIFLKELSTQVFRMCGRMTLMGETRFDTGSPSLNNEEMVATIRKALNYAIRRSSLRSTSSHAPNQLRRAMSAIATLPANISNTFSKLRSRSRPHSTDNETMPDLPTRFYSLNTPAPRRTSRRRLSMSLFLSAKRDCRESSTNHDA